eukprot:5866841-Prorocentrum_lima.AAC.1
MGLHLIEVEGPLWEDTRYARMVLSVLELQLECQILVVAIEDKLHNHECSHAEVVVQPQAI